MMEYKLKRDYQLNPLQILPRENHGGIIREKPYKEDLESLLSNYSLSELSKYFNVNEKTIRKWKKYFGIKTNWKSIRNHARDTYKEVNGEDLYIHNQQKSRKTKSIVYGDETYNNRNKSKLTCLEKYGKEHYLQSQQYKDLYKNKEWYKTIRKKIDATKKINKSFTESKEELEIYNCLKSIFSDVIRQYKSENYPFLCDFYIPSIDTYIEYQGYWMHGKEPYINSIQQKEIVEKWKIKNTPQYLRAIRYWTVMDVEKRNIALKNKLNYLEFFNKEQFYIWFNKVMHEHNLGIV